MGILGSLSFDYDFFNQFQTNINFFYIDSCVSCLYSGINWLYTFTETCWSYDYKILYYDLNNLFFTDSFDFFFSIIWYFNINFSNFNVFWGFILDQYFLNSLFKLGYNNEWYKNVLLSKENSLLFIYHPEVILFNSYYVSNLYLNLLSNIFVSIYNNKILESFITPIMNLIQIFFLIYFISIFLSIYFSFFNTSVKEENFIDSDFISANLLVESEKEIGSIDDMLLGLIFLIYIFGWYVYIHVWSLLSLFPEMLLIFYSFPFLYYIIISMPTYLIYDFGIYFLTYLRGVGASSILIMELMYDYIAFIAFYIRLLVQGVRLILMTFTYIGLHDLIIFFDFNSKLFSGFELIWEDYNNVSGFLNLFSYYFFFIIPIKILHWLYELFHTFFVVTAQFVAFFAMVFWLFLFLYTMFVLEKHENYFTYKRKLKKNKLNNYLNLKNNF